MGHKSPICRGFRPRLRTRAAAMRTRESSFTVIGRCMRNVLTTLLTTGALLGLAGDASAADPATTTFSVTATVLKNCTVTALPLAFGSYTAGGGALAINTTVSVSCTLSTPFNTELTAGTTSGATIAQ